MKQWILLLGNSVQGAKAISRLGYDMVTITDDSLPISDELTKQSKSVFVTDLKDISAVQSICDQIFQLWKKPITVVNFSDIGQMACEHIRQYCGLPRNGVDVAEAVIYKPKMREILNQHEDMRVGYVSGHAEDILRMAPKLIKDHGQLVLKPVDGVGSKHTYTISDMSSLQAILNENNAYREWILEEFLNGAEYSVESYSVDGQTTVLGITEKKIDEYKLEVAQIYPARGLNELQTRMIKETTLKALKVLGVAWGSAHTEVIMSGNGGVKLVETHLRPGGDNIPELLRLVEGKCQYALSIQGLLGHQLSQPACGKKQMDDTFEDDRPLFRSAAITFLTYQGEAGQLRSVEAPILMKNFKFQSNFQLYDRVNPSRCSSQRLGSLLCYTHDKNAYEACLEQLAKFQFKVQ